MTVFIAITSTYTLNIFVGFIFFSAFLLMRADEEWKKADEAIQEGNFRKSKIEATKQMAPTVKLVYNVICILTVTSFYLFHYTSFLLAFVIVFGTSLLVALLREVIDDLDDPISGFIYIHNIPKRWLEKLQK